MVNALDLPASMYYFGTNLHPFWKGPHGNATDALGLLAAAAAQADAVLGGAWAFDAALEKSLAAKGGDAFATVSALVYRQTTGALEKATDPATGEAWYRGRGVWEFCMRRETRRKKKHNVLH